jgi:hypothetical protein
VKRQQECIIVTSSSRAREKSAYFVVYTVNGGDWVDAWVLCHRSRVVPCLRVAKIQNCRIVTDSCHLLDSQPDHSSSPLSPAYMLDNVAFLVGGY